MAMTLARTILGTGLLPNTLKHTEEILKPRSGEERPRPRQQEETSTPIETQQTTASSSPTRHLEESPAKDRKQRQKMEEKLEKLTSLLEKTKGMFTTEPEVNEKPPTAAAVRRRWDKRRRQRFMSTQR